VNAVCARRRCYNQAMLSGRGRQPQASMDVTGVSLSAGAVVGNGDDSQEAFARHHDVQQHCNDAGAMPAEQQGLLLGGRDRAPQPRGRAPRAHAPPPGLHARPLLPPLLPCSATTATSLGALHRRTILTPADVARAQGRAWWQPWPW